MLIALLLQAAIAAQAQAPVDVRAIIKQQDAVDQGQSSVVVTAEQAGINAAAQELRRRASCNGGTIQAGITPGSVYRGEPVRSHPPVHVPGAYPDEGVYAAVIRFGPDGCMVPVPIVLPYAPKPAGALTRTR